MLESVSIPRKRYRGDASLREIAAKAFDWKICGLWLGLAAAYSTKGHAFDATLFGALSSTYYMATAATWHKAVKPALRQTEKILGVHIPGLN